MRLIVACSRVMLRSRTDWVRGLSQQKISPAECIGEEPSDTRNFAAPRGRWMARIKLPNRAK